MRSGTRGETSIAAATIAPQFVDTGCLGSGKAVPCAARFRYGYVAEMAWFRGPARVLATEGVAGLIAVLNSKADELAAKIHEEEKKP